VEFCVFFVVHNIGPLVRVLVKNEAVGLVEGPGCDLLAAAGALASRLVWNCPKIGFIVLAPHGHNDCS